MKLEIGGGGPDKQLGNEWKNIDLVPTADINHDLNVKPWPLADDSVEAFYSSHCLEHLDNPMSVLHEIVRVGIVGAPVEIRVPAPGSDLEFVWDHKHCFSPVAAVNAETHFPREHWREKKRLKLQGFKWEPSMLLERFREEMPMFRKLSDEQVMRWFPRTAHEVRFHYVVQANEFFQ